MSRIEHYKKQRLNRINGNYNGIPLFKKFPRLGKYLPSVPEGTGVLLSAGTGVGKSHSWLGIILYPMYQVIKEGGFNAKFLILLMEDPIEMFEDRLYSRILKEEYNIDVDPVELSSYKESPLSEDIIRKLEAVQHIFDDVMSYCEIVDDITNPTGAYKWCRSKSYEYGTHHTKEIDIIGKDGKVTKTTVYSHYEKNEENLHIIVITDNLNNLSEESGGNVHDSIGKWCRQYGRKQMLKHWKFIMINIIQLAIENERQQYTMRGDAIISKVKPSIAGLGDNKMISRDHHVILGLFSPERYEIEEYMGYDITRLKDNVRFLSILKTNIGQGNKEIALYFNGACSIYKELPRIMTEQDYQTVEMYRNEQIRT